MWLDLREARMLDFVQVDAFTPIALAGNPAAVLFTQRDGDEAWMQAVAEENNLSETAYLQECNSPTPGQAVWGIRWFTPGGEVDLCGHATLASAHALWETGRVPPQNSIVFHTKAAGDLYCSMSGPWIKMDFPAQCPTALRGQELAVRTAEMATALHIEPAQVLSVSRGPPTTPDWLVEVSPESFAQFVPDSAAIRRIEPSPRGLIVTCAGIDSALPPAPKRPRVMVTTNGAFEAAAERFDFLSRFFAPKLGIDEDPVTGSAHCVLAPYWAAKLGSQAGVSMQALQASRRGGLLRIRYLKDSERVELEGQAVTVLRGRFAA